MPRSPARDHAAPAGRRPSWREKFRPPVEKTVVEHIVALALCGTCLLLLLVGILGTMVRGDPRWWRLVVAVFWALPFGVGVWLVRPSSERLRILFRVLFVPVFLQIVVTTITFYRLTAAIWAGMPFPMDSTDHLFARAAAVFWVSGWAIALLLMAGARQGGLLLLAQVLGLIALGPVLA
jgi:hypothetical protein